MSQLTEVKDQLTTIANDLSFENDLGEDAISLAHVLKDEKTIGVLGLIASLPILGWLGPGGVFVWWAIIYNDIRFVGRQRGTQTAQSTLPNQRAQTPTAAPQCNQGDVVSVPTVNTDPIDQEVPNGIDPESLLGQLLASPYQSRAVFGGQRTGKSMAMSIFTQRRHEQGVKIYHINLLSYTGKGDEDATYTKHCVKSVRADFSKLTDTVKRKAKVGEALKVIQQWWDYEGEAILIVDEFAYTASVAVPETEPILKMLGEKLAAIASSGMKREHALYALAPTMVAAELQEAGKRIKSLSPVIVAIAPGHTEQWKGQALTFDVALHGQVNRNFENCVTWPDPLTVPGESRIAFINGEWRALGTDESMLKPVDSKPESDSDVATKTKTKTDAKVHRFADEVARTFTEQFADEEKKGLGQICEYGKLKNLKRANGLEVLSRMLKAAIDSELLYGYCENKTWYVYNPISQGDDIESFDDVDI